MSASWTNNRFFALRGGPRGGQRIQVDHARPSWWLFVHQPSRLRSVVRPCRLRLRWWHGSSCLSPRSHSRAWPVRVRRGPPVCVCRGVKRLPPTPTCTELYSSGAPGIPGGLGWTSWWWAIDSGGKRTFLSNNAEMRIRARIQRSRGGAALWRDEHDAWLACLESRFRSRDRYSGHLGHCTT